MAEQADITVSFGASSAQEVPTTPLSTPQGSAVLGSSEGAKAHPSPGMLAESAHTGQALAPAGGLLDSRGADARAEAGMMRVTGATGKRGRASVGQGRTSDGG